MKDKGSRKSNQSPLPLALSPRTLDFRMNSEEKAAILLLSLDEEQAAEVMKNLRSAEVRRISKYMSRITSISASDVQEVAKEFCDLAKERAGSFPSRRTWRRTSS
ncbi:MAG: hypothetical protein MZV70_75290 [Desulfobacterales bacterium]|nr:hypothetical protein [Desulfobacterales bacterium]